MTGYGEATCKVTGININVRIRSVNHRFFNIQLRLPETLESTESKIDQLIRKHIRRGSISLSLKANMIASEPSFTFNTALVRKYACKLKSLQKTVGSKDELPISVLLELPGVMEPVNSETRLTQRYQPVIMKTIKSALTNLTKMREREGKRLGEMLQSVIRKMSQLTGRIESRVPVVSTHYQTALSKRMNAILKKQKVSLTNNLNQHLAEEIGIFAQRADITEEVQRLKSHLKESTRTMAQETEIGKRLDFLSQEMLREVNTIGSKANDTKIAYWAVALKSEIEKLKEQVQNIE